MALPRSHNAMNKKCLNLQAVTDRKEIGASLAERMEPSVRVRQPANPSSRMSFSGQLILIH